MVSEEFVRDYICQVCHVAILEPHPEDKFANEGYFKCPICGFVGQFKLKNNAVDKIIYGRKK